MSTAAGDLRTLAHEGHTYLYPLVTMETARRQAINLPVDARPGFRPANEFATPALLLLDQNSIVSERYGEPVRSLWAGACRRSSARAKWGGAAPDLGVGVAERDRPKHFNRALGRAVGTTRVLYRAAPDNCSRAAFYGPGVVGDHGCRRRPGGIPWVLGGSRFRQLRLVQA